MSVLHQKLIQQQIIRAQEGCQLTIGPLEPLNYDTAATVRVAQKKVTCITASLLNYR